MVGMDHVTFQTLIAQLDDQLQLRTQLTHKHQSLRKGVTLCRVANANVNTLTDVTLLHIKFSSHVGGHLGSLHPKPQTG